MDRFDNMRVFANVAEIGSFAGAAARLDISPSEPACEGPGGAPWRAASQPHHAQSGPDRDRARILRALHADLGRARRGRSDRERIAADAPWPVARLLRYEYCPLH